MTLQLQLGGPILERRGGIGPVQPVWDDCAIYSAEWYRRFRVWHHETYPDADQGSRDNLEMLIACAEGRL